MSRCLLQVAHTATKRSFSLTIAAAGLRALGVSRNWFLALFIFCLHVVPFALEFVSTIFIPLYISAFFETSSILTWYTLADRVPLRLQRDVHCWRGLRRV